MTLATTAAEMGQTVRTELELREKAGRAEDDPEGHHLLKVFAADTQDFAEKVRAFETSLELTPAGVQARVRTLREPYVLKAEALEQQAGKLEQRQAISRDEAWTKEIALPPVTHFLQALSVHEARKDLAAFSDISQDELLRRPDETGRLARQAAYGLPGLRLTPWGLPGTEKAARDLVAERADVHVAGLRALELRGLARRYRVMVGVSEAPRVLARAGA